MDTDDARIVVMSEPNNVESTEGHTFRGNLTCVQYFLGADSTFVAYCLQYGELFGDNAVPTWFRPELINVYGEGESPTDWHTLLDYRFKYHPDVHDRAAGILLRQPWTKKRWLAGQKLKS